MPKLNAEVAAKYKISKEVVSPIVVTGRWGEVYFEQLNLETADYLYNDKFPFLILITKKGNTTGGDPA